LLARLWPKIDETVRKMAIEDVTPQIKEMLPSMMRNKFSFTKFTLGNVPPELGPIEFYSTPWGVKLEMKFDFDSEVDIEISLGARVGIRQLKFRGTLVVNLGPLIGESPVVGGMVAYFVEPPKLEHDFTGMGNIAEVPGLAGIVNDAFSAAVNSALVLPNVIAMPMATEEQGVNAAHLSQPPPMGVLRATALRASGLKASDWSAFSKSTSDPYVALKLAEVEWHSSTVMKTCDPTWRTDDVCDFVVFDRSQKLSVEVFDEDKLSKDDFLGAARPLLIGEALGESEEGIPLYEDPEKDEIPKNGSVKLRFDWLELMPGSVGPDGCLALFEFRQLRLPAEFGTQAAVSVKVGCVEKSIPLVFAAEQQPLPASAASADEALQQVVLRCGETGLDRKTIATITGLDPDRVAQLLDGASLCQGEVPPQMKTCLSKAPGIFDLNRMLYVPISPAALADGAVEIRAVGKGAKVLSSAALSLQDVVVAPSMEWSPAADDALRLACDRGPGGELKLKVSLQGLRRADNSE